MTRPASLTLALTIALIGANAVLAPLAVKILANAAYVVANTEIAR